MREIREKLRRRLFGATRPCAGLLAAAVLMACVGVLTHTMDIVTVSDSVSPARTVLAAGEEQPRELARLAGLAVGPADRVMYTARQHNAASVSIRRAFPVTLMADGRAYTAEMSGGTVADLLAESGVRLSEDDYVEPALTAALSEQMVAYVRRVTYVEETRREELTEAVLEEYMASLPGEKAPVTSQNGQYDVHYRDRMVDGVLADSEILSIVPVLVPRPADSYEFMDGVACSRIVGFEGVRLGADGLPESYTDMWEGAVCTAYSSSGGEGSSGLGLYCGTVAVNPNVIPYGTRMFITDAEGGFVYGFAIATDTGTAMMEGLVDLDLYFETNDECYMFGKRGLNVYFLDEI